MGLMGRKPMGWIVAAAGVGLVVVSAVADQLGIGGSDGFGWKQILGVIVGAVLVVAGAWLRFVRRTAEPVIES